MKKITIRAAIWNLDAINLYKKNGFTLVSVFSEYFAKDNDMVDKSNFFIR